MGKCHPRGGTFSDTGIAGLTLGGGIGWLGGKHGLASDNLVSADLVTADGQLITTSRDDHPDLFWALRGGGGNFGVVTSFEYQLHPVATVLAGLVVHPFANAKGLVEFYRDLCRSVPDELTTLLACLTDPNTGPVLAIIVCYNDPLDDAERAVRSVREFGPPVVDQVGPMPYCGVQTMADHLAPPGRHWYVKAPFLNEISDEFIEVFLDRFAAVTSPYTLMLLQQKGGAMARGSADRTAFGHRDASHVCVIFAGWEDPTEADRHIEWTRTTAEQLWPYTSGGQYVNDLGLEADEGADQSGVRKQLRTAARGQEHLRPDQPLPAQPEPQTRVLIELGGEDRGIAVHTATWIAQARWDVRVPTKSSIHDGFARRPDRTPGP